MKSNPPDYLAGNVEAWHKQAKDYVDAAERGWASADPHWGIWQLPEEGLFLLPEDMTGLDCLEIGCGTAYVASWMSRRGATVTAIDPTPAQLATANRLKTFHGLDMTLMEGFGEQLPFADASFDFAISEYGAALWADPYAWIPEAARVLRPGGQLVFLTNSPLIIMCSPGYESDGPTEAELLRPYFGLHVTRWPDSPGETEFHLPHGRWVELLTANNLEIERLLELQAPADATTRYQWTTAAWANQWPSEEVWVVRKKL